MATTKNITMKQFNGTDYDTLYPKTIASQIPDVYSKTEVLTTETLSKYGLTADKLPNDVFQQIKTLIDNVQASADGKARIQTGSYVGTGAYGPDNPCSLTFDFAPCFLIITPARTLYSNYPAYDPLYTAYFPLSYFEGNTYKYYSYNNYEIHEYEGINGKYTNNTFYWYCYSNSQKIPSNQATEIQLNHRRTYWYIAIG